MSAWNWHAFIGSEAALRWARCDLESLEAVLDYVPGRTAVVQAGGNLGIFPKRLAQEFATVYTFEPSPDLFIAMQLNAPEKNILRYQAALGCRRELVGVSRTRRDGSSKPVHEGLTHVSGPGVIPTLQIDDLGLTCCDLIYLDVEGYEYYALAGAERTLERCRPVIAVEVNRHLLEVGVPPQSLRDWLARQGYRQAMTLRSDEVYLPAERVQDQRGCPEGPLGALGERGVPA